MGEGGRAVGIFTVNFDGCEFTASHPGCFTPREKPYSQWIIDNRLLGPQSCFSVMVKKTLFARSKVLIAALVKTQVFEM